MTPRKVGPTLVLLVLGTVLAGCANIKHARPGPSSEEEQTPVVQASRPLPVSTPFDRPMACLADRLSERQQPPLQIAVGHVRDYTGKFSEQNGGTAVTQGGAMMVISSLGKLGNTVEILERFDISISEDERRLEQARRLGDDNPQRAQGRENPWRSFKSGRIRQSDAFIVGGITEINYNIASGGAEGRINGIGPRMRTMTLNIAADLRLVDTQTLAVIDTVSLQKQIVGYEVGVEAYRFFGDTLVDAQVGAKNQEALQLGVRAVLEMGVMELVGTMAEIGYEQCLYYNPLNHEPPESLPH